MEFVFSFPATRDLLFTKGLPDDFEGPFVNTSVQQYYRFEYGTIVQQKLEFKDFDFNFFSFQFLKKTSLNCNLQNQFQSLLMYNGESRIHFKNDIFSLKEHQYLLFHYKAGRVKIEINKGQPIQLIHAVYKKGFINELLPAFPEQEDFLKGETKTVLKQAAQVDIRSSLRQILYSEYQPLRLPFYFSNKINEYLFLLLDQAAKPEVEKLLPTALETEAVYRVRELILKDILIHYTIDELARKAKINSARLKIFFKREFGVGPYRFLLNARLEKIKQLIDEGMPIKKAAPLAGYRTTSFNTAFKNVYGLPPGRMKKKDK
jgi:AraC-like DNA-binding protein